MATFGMWSVMMCRYASYGRDWLICGEIIHACHWRGRAFQGALPVEFERGGKTLNILFDWISSCIFTQRDFTFNSVCCTQALCSLTNISPLAASQPDGGLALNPSQQIQRLDSPRGGRGAAISTKGIIDIIKLSVYSINSILYHKQMYGFQFSSLLWPIT